HKLHLHQRESNHSKPPARNAASSTSINNSCTPIPQVVRRQLSIGPPRNGGWRPPDCVEQPDRLRCLTPQPHLVSARTIKQSRIEATKVHKVLRHDAACRPVCMGAVCLNGGKKSGQPPGLLSVLHSKEPGLDCAGATKPPQQGSKPMNELKLDDCSGAEAANDGTFE